MGKDEEIPSKIVKDYVIGEVNIKKIEYIQFDAHDISFIKQNFLSEKERKNLINLTIIITTEK